MPLSLDHFRTAASGRWNKGSVVIADNNEELKKINNHQWNVAANKDKSDAAKNLRVRTAFYEAACSFLHGKMGVGEENDAQNTYLKGLYTRLFLDKDAKSGKADLSRKMIYSEIKRMDNECKDVFKLDDANVQNANARPAHTDGRNGGSYDLLNYSWNYSGETGLKWKVIKRICSQEGDAMRFLVDGFMVESGNENQDPNAVNDRRHLAEAKALRQLAGLTRYNADELRDVTNGANFTTAVNMLNGGFSNELLTGNPGIAISLLKGLNTLSANKEEDLAHKNDPNHEKAEWKSVALDEGDANGPLHGFSLSKLKNGTLALSYKNAVGEAKSLALKFPASYYERRLERALALLSAENNNVANQELMQQRKELLKGLADRWGAMSKDPEHAEQLKHFRDLATAVLSKSLPNVDASLYCRIPVADLLSLVQGIGNDNPPSEGEIRNHVVSDGFESMEFSELRECFAANLKNPQNDAEKAKQAIEFLSDIAFAAADEPLEQAQQQNAEEKIRKVVDLIERNREKFSAVVEACKNGDVYKGLTPMAKAIVDPFLKGLPTLFENNRLTQAAKSGIEGIVRSLNDNLNASVKNLSGKFKSLCVDNNYFIDDGVPPDVIDDYYALGMKMLDIEGVNSSDKRLTMIKKEDVLPKKIELEENDDEKDRLQGELEANRKDIEEQNGDSCLSMYKSDYLRYKYETELLAKKKEFDTWVSEDIANQKVAQKNAQYKMSENEMKLKAAQAFIKQLKKEKKDNDEWYEVFKDFKDDAENSVNSDYKMKKMLGFKRERFENWVGRHSGDNKANITGDFAAYKKEHFETVGRSWRSKAKNENKTYKDMSDVLTLEASNRQSTYAATVPGSMWRARLLPNQLKSILRPEVYACRFDGATEDDGEPKPFVSADVFDYLAATITSPEKFLAHFADGQKPSVEGAFAIVDRMLKSLYDSSQDGLPDTAGDDARKEAFEKTVGSLASFLAMPPAGLKASVIKDRLDYETLKGNIDKGATDVCPHFTELLQKLPGHVVSSVLKGLCRQVIFQNMQKNGRTATDFETLKQFSEQIKAFSEQNINPIYEQMQAWRGGIGRIDQTFEKTSLVKTSDTSTDETTKKFDFAKFDPERAKRLEETYDPNSSGKGGFVERALPAYLDGVLKNRDLKANLMKQLVRGGGEFPKGNGFQWRFFGSVAKGLGPIMQKFLQGYELPPNAPDDMRTEFGNVKEGLIPPSKEEIDIQLEYIKQSSGGRIINIEPLEILGCATVGATVKCRVTTVDRPDGEECVIKLLHPNVSKVRSCEQEFVDTLFDSVKDEMRVGLDEAIQRENIKYDKEKKWLDDVVAERTQVVNDKTKLIAGLLPESFVKKVKESTPEYKKVKDDLQKQLTIELAGYNPPEGEPTLKERMEALTKERLTDELLKKSYPDFFERLPGVLVDELKKLQAAGKAFSTVEEFKGTPVADFLNSHFKIDLEYAENELAAAKESLRKLEDSHTKLVAKLNERKSDGELGRVVEKIKADTQERFKAIERELDFRFELDGVCNGHDAYSKKSPEVECVDVLTYVVPDSSFLIMKLVNGTTICKDVQSADKATRSFGTVNRKSIARLDEKLAGAGQPNEADAAELEKWSAQLLNILELREKLIKSRDKIVTATKVWFDEVLGPGGHGFFHADLHSGNIMTEGDHATLIDFGNFGRLETTQKESIAKLYSSVANGNFDETRFAQAITALGFGNAEALNEEVKQGLRTLLTTAAGKAPENVFLRLAKAIEFLGAEGRNITPPPVLSNFFQAQTRLANSLDEINVRLKLLDASVMSAGKERKWYLDGWPLTEEQHAVHLKNMTDHATELGDKTFTSATKKTFKAHYDKFKANMEQIRKLVKNKNGATVKAVKPIAYGNVIEDVIGSWHQQAA